jgi:hypothetical protein
MSNKLFDENEEHLEDEKPQIPNRPAEEEEDEEFIAPRNLNHDKIFENDYNTGNLDFEEYSNLPKVDTFYAEDNLQDCYDSYEYHRKLDLETKVDDFFKNTEFGKLFANKKKLPKQVLSQVFVSIREQFTNKDFSGTEIFLAISDYFGLNYEVFYENIPSIYRAQLVKELDEKYGILKRKGVKRLF